MELLISIFDLPLYTLIRRCTQDGFPEPRPGSFIHPVLARVRFGRELSGMVFLLAVHFNTKEKVSAWRVFYAGLQLQNVDLGNQLKTMPGRY